MRKSMILLIALTAVIVSAGVVFAHPPKAPVLTWDKAHETLNITAQHNVNDPGKHYILTMTILEGNKQLLLKQYTKQNSAENFHDSVILAGLKSGSKIRVQLVCNIMGSSETEYTIP